MPAAQHEQLQLEFGPVLDKNVEQLKILNTAIFPVRYRVCPAPLPDGNTHRIRPEHTPVVRRLTNAVHALCRSSSTGSAFCSARSRSSVRLY